MKKTKLLTLLTGMAVIITTAVTYSVWDTISDDSTATVSFRKPVTISVGDTYTLSTSAPELGKTPSASGDVEFTVSNDAGLAKSLKLVPTVTGAENCSAEDFDFEITDKGDSNKSLTGSTTDGFTDTSLETTSYTVKVTPKEGTVGKVAGKNLNIKLEATLSK